MNVKVKEIMAYKGHSIKENGNVDLTLKARYSELVNSVGLLQMLNNDVKIAVKIGSDKPFKIGMFRIKSIAFDGDGESTVKFNSLSDFVEIDQLNRMITKDEFTCMFNADIEEEESESEEE